MTLCFSDRHCSCSSLRDSLSWVVPLRQRLVSHYCLVANQKCCSLRTVGQQCKGRVWSLATAPSEAPLVISITVPWFSEQTASVTQPHTVQGWGYSWLLLSVCTVLSNSTTRVQGFAAVTPGSLGCSRLLLQRRQRYKALSGSLVPSKRQNSALWSHFSLLKVGLFHSPVLGRLVPEKNGPSPSLLRQSLLQGSAPQPPDDSNAGTVSPGGRCAWRGRCGGAGEGNEWWSNLQNPPGWSPGSPALREAAPCNGASAEGKEQKAQTEGLCSRTFLELALPFSQTK